MSAPMFSDAPPLRRNALLGGLQLVFWLFVRPTAWVRHMARIDPALPPDISLAELSLADWRNPALRRLVLQGYGAWLLLSGLVFGAASALAGMAVSDLVFGLINGLLGALVFGLILGATVSIAVGIAGSFALSLLGWIAVLAAAPLAGGRIGRTLAALLLSVPALDREAALAVGIAYAMATAAAAGLIGGVAAALARHTPRGLAGRQAGGVLIGIAINAAAYVLTIGFIKSGAAHVAISLLCSLGAGMFARPPRRRAGRVALIAAGGGLLYLGLIGFARAQVSGEGSPLLGSLASSVTGFMWLACFFAMPAVLARRSAGAWAGAAAGALGMGLVALTGMYLVGSAAAGAGVLWPILPLGAACALLGFSQGWWRPLLSYPLLAAANLLLLRADARRFPPAARAAPARHPALRWHSALWDEHQWLRLAGLDEHLLLLLERAPAAGRAAGAFLLDTPQRWAPQRAQLEWEARQLEACGTLEALIAACAPAGTPGIADARAEGAAGAILRSLGRIGQDCAAALAQSSTFNQRLLLSACEEGLDGLLRELGQSADRAAPRFQPIVRSWRAIVAERRQALAETVEQQQLIDSPYVIGVPLTARQAMFVGRAEISARIESLVLDRQCPPLLVYGQRRMGKTSLLNNLSRLLPEAIVPLFVDLQGPATQASGHDGFLAALARAMTLAARRGRGLELPPLDRQELRADPFPRFDEWLDEAEAALAGRTALLMLDEFEALEDALAAGRFDETAVLGWLRHTIQHRPRFRLLLAGSHTLAEAQRWSAYLINAQPLQIGCLSREETRQLAEQPLPDFPLAYEPAASARVFGLTSGHPALTQLLCAEIVALKNSQPSARRRLASPADVEAAAAAALERGSFFFADLERNQLDPASAALARQAAAAGEAAAWRPAAEDRPALELALRREVLVSAAGGYRFQVELIRRWFAQDAQQPALADAAGR